ncbi:MAG: hypothetical protein ACK4RK_04385 [Gemmataceae bacterium]
MKSMWAKFLVICNALVLVFPAPCRCAGDARPGDEQPPDVVAGVACCCCCAESPQPSSSSEPAPAAPMKVCCHPTEEAPPPPRTQMTFGDGLGVLLAVVGEAPLPYTINPLALVGVRPGSYPPLHILQCVWRC